MRNTRRFAALAAATAFAIAASGCAAAGPAHRGAVRPARPVILTTSQVATLRAYGSGDTAFGLNLISALCAAQPAGNVVLSPFSVATGLGMAFLGARGSTATAMTRVLHLPATGPSLVAGLRARAALLGSLNSRGVSFKVSNRIWADPSMTTRRHFLAELRSGYQASLRQIPLRSRPERARRIINASVAADTAGHISELLPPGSLNAAPGWMLTDALYLKAAWAQPFDHSRTAAAPFTTGSGHVNAEYLNGDGFATAKADGWSVAALPYRGSRLTMLALLPPAPRSGRSGGCQTPSQVTLGMLTSRLASGAATSAISLPKIALTGTESLRGVLSALGMGVAFTPRADFTGISANACCIGFVRHAATLTVGERGTVATAATAVSVQAGAALLTVLRFDRPYLLLIRDTLTGEPLMLAWVANPNGS